MVTTPIIPVLREATRGQCLQCIARRACIVQHVAILQIAGLGRSVLISKSAVSYCAVCGAEETTYRLA